MSGFFGSLDLSRLPDGSATAPARAYVDDTNLGSYRIGADNEGFAADGVLRWDYNTVRINLTIPMYLPNGTAAAPGIAFSSDTDTGAYRIGADNLGFSAGGVSRWDYNTTRINTTIPIYLPDGTATAPALSFQAATGVGLSSSTTDNIRISTGGAFRLHLDSARLRIGSDHSLDWAEDTNAGLTAGDLKLFRDAANTLAQRNGTNAQTFRLYNTFTSASDYERLAIQFVSNVAEIRTQADGTGTVRNIAFLGGRIGVGTASPATSALLDLSSTTGALLVPRMTTTQRDNLTAADGMILYNTTTATMQGYVNGAWTNL